MNIKQLQEYLTAFKKWFKTNKAQATSEQKEREQLSETIQQYTKEQLQKMSEEEFFDYIAPLWAMAMWGNKHYQVDNIIEANGMPLLREQFANLIYGSATLEKRWDEFRSKIKGVGPAIMSELLCKTFPNEYLIWNRKTYNGFTVLEIPNLPRYEARLNGKTYEVLSKHGRDIVEFAQKEGFTDVSDMLTLNTFIWQELQIPSDECVPSTKVETLSSKNGKDDLFIHNDIRINLQK